MVDVLGVGLPGAGGEGGGRDVAGGEGRVVGGGTRARVGIVKGEDRSGRLEAGDLGCAVLGTVLEI